MLRKRTVRLVEANSNAHDNTTVGEFQSFSFFSNEVTRPLVSLDRKAQHFMERDKYEDAFNLYHKEYHEPSQTVQEEHGSGDLALLKLGLLGRWQRLAVLYEHNCVCVLVTPVKQVQVCLASGSPDLLHQALELLTHYLQENPLQQQNVSRASRISVRDIIHVMLLRSEVYGSLQLYQQAMVGQRTNFAVFSLSFQADCDNLVQISFPAWTPELSPAQFMLHCKPINQTLSTADPSVTAAMALCR
jgi:hypothetical protein